VRCHDRDTIEAVGAGRRDEEHEPRQINAVIEICGKVPVSWAEHIPQHRTARLTQRWLTRR
jgi:hypothetical protein